ncbi:MAG: bifunctional methylenetetrahydrofolate dehydrogenase/methenyltetrahydrofolate cyclohydrolase FolD [Solirubrobacteraceae bacterium MAG38_C4-C5]|nr:bifunctional methylenetetrahydrofolate dehydrogenase/methenyltetrahydrofolate cyclohydrolase FolD [Candidatus Siliceabacter maunaloa]
MKAQVIDGRAVAARMREEVAEEVRAYTAQHAEPPGLATVLVGDDEASAVYVAGKQRACEEVGIRPYDHRLPADVPEPELAALLDRLNGDPRVSGILLQLPVPPPLDGTALTGRIHARKDVDGLTAVSAGALALGHEGLRPCTPAGVMRLLAEAGTELEGADAVVIGRSNLFGKPMAQLLLAANATVTICHSRTRHLAHVCRRADVIIAAVGRARMVTADWVKPGATVIDVGVNRLDTDPPTLAGDVDFDAVSEVAAAITPVPGGVGPMTIACLLRNTVRAARLQRAEAAPALRGEIA